MATGGNNDYFELYMQSQDEVKQVIFVQVVAHIIIVYLDYDRTG